MPLSVRRGLSQLIQLFQRREVDRLGARRERHGREPSTLARRSPAHRFVGVRLGREIRLLGVLQVTERARRNDDLIGELRDVCDALLLECVFRCLMAIGTIQVDDRLGCRALTFRLWWRPIANWALIPLRLSSRDRSGRLARLLRMRTA